MEPLLALDGHGVVLEVNRAAAAFLGRERASLRGEPLISLVSAATREPLERTLEELERDSRAEMSLTFSDSCAGTASRRVYLHRLPDEPPVVAVRIGLGAKAMEESFVVNAAHQLRAPLAGIANAIEVLQSGAKETASDRDRFLDHIERAVLQLSQVTRAMLVLARAQWREQPPRVESVSIGEALEAARRAGLSRASAIDVSCDPSIVALGEWDLIAETLAALVENAIEHAPDAKIALRAAPYDEHTVEIAVDDEGAGIMSDVQARVFDTFSAGAGASSGFGLGLAIARQAAEAMGGTLTVESGPHGSHFALRLPAAAPRP